MIAMKSFLVLCLYISISHAWNVGRLRTPNGHRYAVTFCRSADDSSTISRTTLKYGYGDGVCVEHVEKGTERVPLRREKLVVRKPKQRIKRKLHKYKAKFMERVANGSNQRGTQIDGNIFISEYESNGKNIARSKIKSRPVVKNVHELRTAILDHDITLEDVEFDTSLITSNSNGKENVAPSLEGKKITLPFDHAVLDIINKRAQTNSKPGVRAADDKAHLALSIEGGGMRGATSAGMAVAIATLGLFDSFDSVYGSSAGSVVGAYMVSRQTCVDIYTDVLTAAKKKFVSKARLLSYVARGMLDRAVNETIFTKDTSPAMNISYVLDSIMDSESGIRPLDIEHFKRNDKIQPLRIVASSVRDGVMETSCLGSTEMDFFNEYTNDSPSTVRHDATINVDEKREGLFACLQVSMTVPAACGPPVKLLRNKDAKANITSYCFDAFCFEPIPYRSAVEEGATHVLALRSRPHGMPVQTKPGFFEKIVAPNYFKSHDMPQCAEFFKKGGQQYIYAEDYLTLDEGFSAGKDGILIPPPNLLYGIQHDEETLQMKDRSSWKRAHLLPVVVPEGNTEHPTLSVDRQEVLHAVRQGFSAAFDMLAPISGVQLEEHLTGDRVAQLIFTPSLLPAEDVLDQQVRVPGDTILNEADMFPYPCQTTDKKHLETLLRHAKTKRHSGILEEESARMKENIPNTHEDLTDAIELLNMLPGFQAGKMGCLSQGLNHLVSKL